MGKARLREGQLENRAMTVFKFFFLFVLQNIELADQLSSQLGIALQGNLHGMVDHV
ncbi:hypothetical protein PAERUG_P1_London_28_IMP_1_04_05_00162 [Pseudomonas aeruginosa]|mgnify:CR=1 FL=1|nr:hypothetical protein Q031_05861 [Pseudomonas aeruginosa BWHPSA018]CRN66322.1 hypothetical protein PAERUG_P39_London_29_08_12_01053 [Pseudomonas aeruginosa]CRN75028.1 hypothetical protein PAERUG_P1_London_28_IMP_1_04_05_00162 [Pseudomonas aeruginosa]